MPPDGGRLGALFLTVTSLGAAVVKTPVTRRAADGEQRFALSASASIPASLAEAAGCAGMDIDISVYRTEEAGG